MCAPPTVALFAVRAPRPHSSLHPSLETQVIRVWLVIESYMLSKGLFAHCPVSFETFGAQRAVVVTPTWVIRLTRWQNTRSTLRQSTGRSGSLRIALTHRNLHLYLRRRELSLRSHWSARHEDNSCKLRGRGVFRQRPTRMEPGLQSGTQPLVRANPNVTQTENNYLEAVAEHVDHQSSESCT